jgi:hypothetical protein
MPLTHLLPEKATSLRSMHVLFGMLSLLREDPLCQNCSCFAKSIEEAKDRFSAFEPTVNGLPEEMRKLMVEIYELYGNLAIGDNTERHREEERCGVAEGFCFAQSALVFHKNMEMHLKEEKKTKSGGSYHAKGNSGGDRKGMSR